MISKPHADRHWSGHFPVTSTALLSILERAARGETRFSTLERRLHLACEVWAAVNAGELEVLFAAGGVLRHAPAAFSAIGAERVAEVLCKASIRPIGRIAALENDLKHVSEPVDELIARFARSYLGAAAQLRESAPALSQRASG
jgi:hypothetical protein